MYEKEKIELQTAKIEHFLALRKFCNTESDYGCIDRDCDKCSIKSDITKLRENILYTRVL